MVAMIPYYMFGHCQIQTALVKGQASRLKKIGQTFKILRFLPGDEAIKRGAIHPSVLETQCQRVSGSLGPWVPGSRTLAPNLIYQRGNSLQEVTTDWCTENVYTICASNVLICLAIYQPSIPKEKRRCKKKHTHKFGCTHKQIYFL